MISFIVIGYNEQKNVARCLESVYATILHNSLSQYEILYVDSMSSDQSVEIVARFLDVKIFCISGDRNAAIARNIGAMESKGDILFFIDADMEIQKEFLSLVLLTECTLRYDFVSGDLIDVLSDGKSFQRPSNKNLPGGIFLIKRKLWFLVDGMNTKYQTGEDLDFGLRLRKKGCKMVRLGTLITKHYTVLGLDNSRAWKMILNKQSFYARSVLYRNHLFNFGMYQQMWQVDKTFLVFVIGILISLLFPKLLYFMVGTYLVSIILRSIKQARHLSLAEFVLYYITFDVANLVFFFFLFPARKPIKYLRYQPQAAV